MELSPRKHRPRRTAKDTKRKRVAPSQVNEAGYSLCITSGADTCN